MNTRHAHILALMSIAVASFGATVGSDRRVTLIMAGLLAFAAVATLAYERRQRAQQPAQAVSASGKPKQSLVNTKRMLMLMLAIGIVMYAGGQGTFATFSAETSNEGSTTASGTLTMSDQVNTSTACVSSAALSYDNYNTSSCTVPLTLANQAPGIFGGQAKLTIANTGSLDASKLFVYAPYVNGQLATAIASGSTISGTSITTSALEGNVVAGDTIELDYGGHTQLMVANANVNPGATSIPIRAASTLSTTLTSGNSTATLASTALLRAGMTVTGTGIPANTTIAQVTNGTTIVLSNNATASGAQSLTYTVIASADFKADATSGGHYARVYDTSSNAAATSTDCFDTFTTSSPVPGAKVGTDLNFNGYTAGATWDQTNTYCQNMLFFVQEQESGVPLGVTGQLTSGSANVTINATDGTTGQITAGMGVSGTGIPASTTVLSVTNATTFVLSNNATATGGQWLTFTSGGNPVMVTANYCWYGAGSPLSASTSLRTSNGMCYAPISAGFSGTTTVTASTSSLTFASALTGNIKSGDTLTISESQHKVVTCVAGADAYWGATSVSVGSCASAASGGIGSGVTYSSAATIVDSTINNGLNADTVDTLTSFDTSSNFGNKLELASLGGNGSKAPSGGGVSTLELAKHGSTGDTRVFYIGVFFPAGTGSAQNALQGLQATFGLSWHIDQ